MVYKIKRGSIEQEEKYLEKRTKGHPSFAQIERFEFRRLYHIPQQLHKIGTVVNFDDEKIGKIKKVTDKGIYIQEFKAKGDIIELNKKLIFFSNEKIESGKIYPINIGLEI